MKNKMEREEVIKYLNKLPLIEFPMRIEMLYIQVGTMILSFILGIGLGSIIWR